MEHSPNGPTGIVTEGRTLKIFKPRKSFCGWLSSVTLVGAMGAIVVISIRANPRGILAGWVLSGLVIALMIAAIFFLSIFPTMKYAVGPETVRLSCGPFKWHILITGIRSTTEKDLDYLPRSEGWKLPGYTLFRIQYGRIGPVRMCATSMTKRVLLITTDTDTWGITPANVDSFVSAVNRGRRC